ncbi:uncharacterized protein LOC105684964 [Athalia rosae]|uniref:uncharacterized protein LOC105684964 n=1 Tax=Athalia rosae TaxID=37344 RepID=UPI00203360C0|nr:uncharacterized protein LOC105684964 [Athalia rosae]
MRDRVFFEAILVAFFLKLASGGPMKNETAMLPGNEFFNNLPEYIRRDFLTFELGRGYIADIYESDIMGDPIADELLIVFPDSLAIPDKLIDRLEALDVPEKFASNLLNFVKTKFNLDRQGIRTLIISRTYCFEVGFCINIDDVGAFCCPF